MYIYRILKPEPQTPYLNPQIARPCIDTALFPKDSQNRGSFSGEPMYKYWEDSERVAGRERDRETERERDRERQ